MSRELPDWINGYLRYVENSEPPTSYHHWCAASVVAGALQRKVYLPWGFERIYPNMFAVLVGHSGRTRKGLALGIAKELLSRIGTVSVSPESGSREAIILAMKRAMTNYTDATDGTIRLHCSLTAFSEELAVLLGQGDIKLLANLTDWYDSKESWAYETVGRGRDALQGLCFNLMGATAPEWLQSMLPQEAIGGGFTSRVIFIVEERKKQTVPKHEFTNEERALYEMLIKDLERISQLNGEFKFTPRGEKAYIDWYSEQDKLLSQGKPAVEDTRFAGYCERRTTHLRKLMMIMSASEGESLAIDLPHFERALGLLLDTERRMHKTFGGLGSAKYSDVNEKIMTYLRNIGITTRSALVTKFYRDLDVGALEACEELMERMKVVQITLQPGSRDKVYRWIGEKK